MEIVGILLANLAAVIMIALILIYLVQDRRRFRVERQFRAVRDLFDEWVRLAGELPGCGELAASYQASHNVSEKYRIIADLITASQDGQSPRMRALEEELTPFLGIYTALAGTYNRHLFGRFREPVMGLLGFRRLPNLRFEENPAAESIVSFQ